MLRVSPDSSSSKLMTLSGDLSSTSTQPIDRAAVGQVNGFLPAPEADLVFTQARSGECLSFFWRDAAQFNLNPSHLVGKPLTDGFAPLAIAPYLGRVCRVLERLQPERFNYPFRCADQYLIFDLVVSPILLPQAAATTAVVMGKFLHTASKDQAAQLVNDFPQGLDYCPDPDSFRKPLTKVAWNIRRNLDLEAIWQQTVDGLGEALQLSRCLICDYKPEHEDLEIVAEYRLPGFDQMLGHKLNLTENPYLKQAIDTHIPVALTAKEFNLEERSFSILAVATCYQDQPNGLLILHQFEPSCMWSDAEITLIRELADQVGTGIAHAMLFAASCNLTAELQRANDSLVQQHQELEDARQQAEEASRLKSEFLANTSHELRTPLNGMIGFLKLVIEGMADDPAEQNEFIEEAYRSALHLLNIINDILDIAKIEAGKMQLDMNPVQLEDLLTDVENFTRTQALQKGLSFEIRTPATRDEVILFGNYQRLLQVMLNVVGNAIKFTHEGGITITAEVIPKKVTFQDQERPGVVKISVADTGIGVSLEKQDKLFQSFSQVDGSRTRQYGGTGLGLAISQKLVEAMGGIVNFYSMGEGLGSTVTFTVLLYQDALMITTPSIDATDLTL